MTERAHAERLDAADPLRGLRAAFEIPEPEPIYLDGNSLGRLPKATLERLSALVRDDWGGRVVRGWDAWMELPVRVGDALAAGFLGARPGEVIVSDSTTVNLYRLAVAALQARPGRRVVLAAADEFPTDRCAVPIDLHRSGVELAVGCTYKYLNGGPGAPAFLYVRRELQDVLRQPIQGWFGQRDQFAMGHPYDPQPGIAHFLTGTPSVLGLVAIEAGVEVLARAGIEALRAKSTALTELVIALWRAWLEPLGFTLGSPADPARRGGHVALRHPDAYRIDRALVERANVVPDFRAPDRIRLAPVAAYTRFTEVWDAMDRLRRLVEAGERVALDPARSRVT